MAPCLTPDIFASGLTFEALPLVIQESGPAVETSAGRLAPRPMLGPSAGRHVLAQFSPKLSLRTPCLTDTTVAKPPLRPAASVLDNATLA